MSDHKNDVQINLLNTFRGISLRKSEKTKFTDISMKIHLFIFCSMHTSEHTFISIQCLFIWRANLFEDNINKNISFLDLPSCCTLSTGLKISALELSTQLLCTIGIVTGNEQGNLCVKTTSNKVYV